MASGHKQLPSQLPSPIAASMFHCRWRLPLLLASPIAAAAACQLLSPLLPPHELRRLIRPELR
eukprot:6195801-Pleurochrysis_carterae.AAC.4